MKMTEWLRLKSGPDIRGDAMEHDGKAPTLTEGVARCIGYAFALWLAEKTHTTTDRLVISVGRDSRLSGEKLAAAFIKGLTAADCDVLDCGLCTTPAMALTTIMMIPPILVYLISQSNVVEAMSSAGIKE